MFYGNVILPFIDRFPKDTELYRIMTTRLSEIAPEGGEGQDNIAIEHQALTLAGMGDVGQLVGGDIQLLGENLPVASRGH